MANIRTGREALIRRILDGTGEAPASERRGAFQNSGLSGAAGALADKVARNAWKVTDEDIDAVRTSGLSEDRIFEIVVCAAVGQANRQYDTALAALELAGRRSER